MKPSLVMMIISMSLFVACTSPAKIEIKPEFPNISNYEPSVLTAIVKDSQGKVLDSVDVEFSSVTPAVLTINPKGMMQAVRSGNGVILVKAGSIKKKIKVNVQIPAKIVISPEAPVFNVGIRRDLKATLYNDRDKPFLGGDKVKWSTSNPDIVSITKDGMIKTLKEGKSTITAAMRQLSGSTVITVEHEKLQEDGYLGHSKR